MASSSEPVGKPTPEERKKQVTAWLREILEQDPEKILEELLEEDLEDNIDVLFKLMKHQVAAEKQAQEQIKVLKERAKFFKENAEKLEAGLRAGKIAPGQLPQQAREILKSHARAAVLLGVEDSRPESFKKKFEELFRQREELKARLSQEQALSKDLEQLRKRVDQHLMDATVGDKHMTAAEEEYRFKKWQKFVSKYNLAVRKAEVNRSKRQKLEELAQTLSLVKKLHRLELREKELDSKLPAADLPLDKNALGKLVEQKRAEVRKSEAALTDELIRQRNLPLPEH
ncbi:uncharacterized protein LOC119159361 [Rhipicephalus microplus]|uniref:uncharacterized protein LOC119159361 n=1 Tax=Rhipicephalus microplus TaxID=6941 RepID=UPI003F6BAFA9